MTRRNSRCCTNALVLAVLVLTTAVPVTASTDTTGVDSVAVIDSVIAPVVDTLLFRPQREVSLAEAVTNPVNLEEHLYQQPTVALFKSLLVPGLGQLGNRSYFKAILFAGLETWFIASALHYHSQASDAREIYLNSNVDAVRWEFYNLYDNKRTNRNKFAWFAGLTAFVSMFDAYVDAHLSGSPVDPRNDDFSLDVAPTDNGGVAALLTYRF